MAALAVVSAAGSIAQGEQQKKLMEYNARVAENEGIAARQSAEYEEAQHRKRTSKLLSTARARIAGSGVEVEGSPLLALAESAEEAELDALTIRRSGTRAEAQARAQAAADRFQGRMYQQAGYFGAATALLKGATEYGVATGKFSATPGKARRSPAHKHATRGLPAAAGRAPTTAAGSSDPYEVTHVHRI